MKQHIKWSNPFYVRFILFKGHPSQQMWKQWTYIKKTKTKSISISVQHLFAVCYRVCDINVAKAWYSDPLFHRRRLQCRRRRRHQHLGSVCGLIFFLNINKPVSRSKFYLQFRYFTDKWTQFWVFIHVSVFYRQMDLIFCS